MFPHMIGRRGPGVAVMAGGSGGATDGGFVADPVVTTTASGNTTVKGQVKPGSFGKFVYPLATIAAGRQYTFRYTPQFQQLAQQGKLAMVGFGLKNGNDFHIVGLRGNGTTGVNKYKVNGTPPNGWNKDTGHTTSDGGAAANGTQAGPNYIRLVVSADGATYKFQTSPDGSTWTDEYTAQTPTPFSNVSGVLTFGIALWFNNADAGPFSIVIDQFADVVPAVPVAISATANDHTFAGNPFTSAAISIGAAAADRVTAIGFDTQNVGTAATITGVTCGGNAMTRRVQSIVGAGDRHAEIWEIASGTGSPLAASTTAVFAVTMSTGNLGIVHQVYRITGSAVGGGSGSSTATGTTSVTGTVPANGAAIVVCGQTNINAGSISNVTENVNAAETASNNQRGIVGSTTTAGSLTSTYSGTGSSTRMVMATYAPP